MGDLVNTNIPEVGNKPENQGNGIKSNRPNGKRNNDNPDRKIIIKAQDFEKECEDNTCEKCEEPKVEINPEPKEKEDKKVEETKKENIQGLFNITIENGVGSGVVTALGGNHTPIHNVTVSRDVLMMILREGHYVRDAMGNNNYRLNAIGELQIVTHN